MLGFKGMVKLLLATNNNGKVNEYRNLLRELPFQVVTLAEQGIITVVDEVGSTLEENARLKATVMANESGLLALADDSGLEVDALDGEPGPLSARGEGGTDGRIGCRKRCVGWEWARRRHP